MWNKYTIKSCILYKKSMVTFCILYTKFCMIRLFIFICRLQLWILGEGRMGSWLNSWALTPSSLKPMESFHCLHRALNQAFKSTSDIFEIWSSLETSTWKHSRFQIFFPEKGFYYYYCWCCCCNSREAGGTYVMSCPCCMYVCFIFSPYYKPVFAIQTEKRSCCTEMFVFMHFYMWLYIPPSTMQWHLFDSIYFSPKHE